MILSEISIKRPVFALVMSILLLIFGIFCFWRLPVRELPDIDYPSLTIVTTYSGASPEVMESRVTRVIENELSGVSGITKITSNSRNGRSWISIEFKSSKNMLEAVSDARDAVSRARKKLPDDIDEPVVSRDSGDGEVVLWLNLSSTVMDRVELSDYARNVLEKNLSLADGVSQIELVGALEKVMYVRLIPQKMASMGVTVDDIVKALGNENIELPSGEIRNQDMVFPVQLKKVYVDNSVFELLPVRHQGIEKTIRLRDVANIEIKAKNEESIYRRNGISSIGIGVIPQSNANPLDVAMNIRDQVMVLKKNLPEDLILDVDYDSTVYISNSIREVYETLGITVILVIIVLYLFIGTVSTTLIPAVTVPVSVIASFIGAYFLGFSINIITLLSLILAIGLVVDDAIVMVENISFHIKKGEGVLAACWNGAREVGFAIVATSVVLIIIFLPLMFMQGLIGKMFIEFAVLLSFAVFFSSFIALTLSPALCSWLLKPSKGKSEKNLSYFLDYIIGLVEVFYEKILRQILKRLYIYPAVIMAVTGIMVILYQTIPHQLSPKEDRGVVYIYALGSEGASIHRMKRSMLDLEERLLPKLGKGVVKSLSFSTPSLGQGSDQSGFVVIQLDDWDKRDISSTDFIKVLNKELADISDLTLYIYQPGFKGSSGSPIKYVIKGSDYDELNNAARKLIKDAGAEHIIINADTNYNESTPEIEAVIDYNKAAVLGVTMSDISRALQTYLGGTSHTTYMENDEEYNVYLRADEKQFKDITDVASLNIRTEAGKMVPLSSVAEFKLVAKARKLPHFDRKKAITISAHPAPNLSLGEALDWMDTWSSKNLSRDMSVSLNGESRNFREGENELIMVFIMAIIVTYLALSAQFESFIHPVAVMITVPLGVFGGLLGLWMMRLSLNIYSEIGLLLLVGMVTKNGILIVEFANQLRRSTDDLLSATVKASVRRLKPILMTSLTAIIGALPLITAGGSGFESRQSVGAVIFYGMGIATIITLIILPGFYYILARYTAVTGDRDRRLHTELQAGKEK
ncbi:MAG: efflux RND transporter permease subunit [Ruminobacter sp.]|nr:efflux RND transporter permease subunit [Ruminobacter sp.]